MHRNATDLLERPADILVVFYYGAFLPVANGGNARLVDLLDRLVAEFSRIALYSYADHPDCPWIADAESSFRQRWPKIELVLERRGRLLPQLTRLKNLLLTFLPQSWALGVLAFTLPHVAPRWNGLRRRSGAVLVSYAEGLTQLNGVDPARCLVETHDVNFVKWSKLRDQRAVSFTALRKLRGEMTALGTVRGLVAISAGEAAFFRMMLSQPVAFIPRWSASRAVPLPRTSAHEYDLVFVGSAYAMNVRGFCALLAEHGQWLSLYRIAVCGLVCDDAAVREAARRYPNIALLGFVERIDDIYLRSRAALSPVDGTGTKMKVLAALGAGLPVFASPQSREGLPQGHEGAVFPISAAAVTSVLGSETRLQAARAQALRYETELRAAGDSTEALALLRKLVPDNHPPKA